MFSSRRGVRRRIVPAVEPLEERALLSVAGTLDPTFGNGGIQSTDINGWANAVAIDRSGGPTNGDIYVAGTADDPGVPNLKDFVLARYLPNGQLDTNFGDGGEILTNFGGTPIGAGNDSATAVAVQRNGRIVVAGSAVVTNSANPNAGAVDFAVARYNPDGSPDTSFGTNGLVAFDFTSLFANRPGADLINALGIDGRNRIVVGGTARDPASGLVDFALARLDPSGKLDSNFGSNGLVIGNINNAQGLGPGDDTINGLAIDASDNIVVAGSAHDGNTGPFDFAVARYLPTGLPDGGFGTFGATVTSFGAGSSAEANAVALGPGGWIVVAGDVFPGGFNESFGLAEYQSNGVLNPAFGNAGKTTTAINNNDHGKAVAFDSAGNVVVAGYTFDLTLGAWVFALARYTPAGALDPTFDPGGRLPGVVTTSLFRNDDEAYALAIQPDGNIVAAGFARQPNGDNSIALARYNGTKPAPAPPPPPHRPIVAELVPVKVGKRRKLMVEVLDAATGALKDEFLSPFQHPPYSAIQASAVQGNGAGLPDEVLLTARRGRHTVSATFIV
jgi:uncharacterized delta-60 repeat protein